MKGDTLMTNETNEKKNIKPKSNTCMEYERGKTIKTDGFESRMRKVEKIPLKYFHFSWLNCHTK